MDLNAHLDALPRRHIPSDLERILSMERTPTGPDSDAADRWTAKLGKGGATFRPIQGAVFNTMEKWGGGFGSITVGAGKELAALVAGTAGGFRRPVVMVPPALVKQMEAAADRWGRHFEFTPPTVVSYGALSTQTDLLERLEPDLIIADEAHYLRHKSAARTRRFLRYFNRRRCGFLALSGTITAKSLLDFSHLLELALRDRAPIPLDRWELERWAACIDPDGEPTQEDLGRLGHLVRWSSQSTLAQPTKKTIRAAFRERLTTTPGVIATRTGSCDASLHLIHHRPAHSPAVRAALKTLAERWETPDGEPIADASTKSRAFKSLAIGFYYRWEWGATGPDGVWLEARRNLSRLVGRVLRYSPREGRDSEKLVLDWARSGKGSADLKKAVAFWDEIKHRASPTTEAVWICGEKMQYIFDWLFDLSDPALLWHTSNAVGLSLAGMGLAVHGAGSSPPTGGTAGVKIQVHGEGCNLQTYRVGFVLEPPSSGSRWEQVLGRTHRSGQRADTVECHYFDFGDALGRARAHAEYIEDTQGTPQKLNLATFLDA